MSNDLAKTLFICIFVGVLIVASPIVWIWCVNTLFPVADIPYNFDTWLASLLISGAFGGTTFSRKSK